jgi:chorismate mutase
MNIHAPIREIVISATTDALNTTITENQIQPEKIISVILQPAKNLAVGDWEAKVSRVVSPVAHPRS